MGIDEEVQEGWERFKNWLGSIGQTLSDTWGQLAQGIYSGLAWVGSKIKDAFEWIYKGLVSIGEKLKEAYQALAEFINTGLQWIGAGFSWLGANFYKFGHWLYNGVVVLVKWIIVGTKAVINWFARVLSAMWNGLCSIPNLFVSGFNDFINDFALGLRSKFKLLIFVNTTIPIMGKQIERIPERMSEAKSTWGIIGAIIAPFITPIATYALAETLDNIVPKPSSQKVNLFFAPTIPEIFTESLDIPIPEELPEPEMVMETIPSIFETVGAIPFTAAGYTPEGEKAAGIGMQYELLVDYGLQAFRSCGIGISKDIQLE